MSLPRKQIRAAIIALLNNQTDADDRVYPSRVKPVWTDEYPLILVYTSDEDVEIYAESWREYQRKLTVRIEIICEQSEVIDDELDVIGQQVENRMYNQGHTLGELASDVVLQGAQMTFDKEGKKLYGSLVLSYQVIYHTVAAIDPTDLEYLTGVDVEYDLQEGVSAENPTDQIDGLSAL